MNRIAAVMACPAISPCNFVYFETSSDLFMLESSAFLAAAFLCFTHLNKGQVSSLQFCSDSQAASPSSGHVC